jgi:hypothetical protein
MEFERLIQQTLLSHKGGVEGLAQALGKSTSALYRFANPNDESSFPLLALPAVLKETGDARITRFLARVTGHAIIKVSKRVSKFGPKTIMSLQAELLDLVKVMMGFNAGSATRAEALDALWRGVECLLYIRRMIETGTELPLEQMQVEFQFDTGVQHGREHK